MNHPDEQLWSEYLYGELSKEQKKAFDKHLDACDLCRQELRAFQSVKNRLDDWRIEDVPATRRGRPPRGYTFLKGAVAAMILLAVGLMLGRQTAPQLDLQALENRLRSDLTATLQPQLQQQWRMDLAQARTQTSQPMQRAVLSNVIAVQLIVR